jgi:hypothetical protein
MTKKLAPEVFQSLPDTNICDRPESEFPDRARGELVSRGGKIVEIIIKKSKNVNKYKAFFQELSLF